MQTWIDPDRPSNLPAEMRSLDDQFNNLVFDIDVCTERFMQLQTNMTTALDRYKGCCMVGMDAHMLGRLVLAIIDIGLTIQQVEKLQQRLLDLYLIDNDMWEATQAIEHHLDDLLHIDSEAMVNHVYDNMEENLPITPLLEACQIAQPVDEERGPVEPTMGECTIDDEFKYLASEIDEVTGQFMSLQKTMITTLERYTRCLLLSGRIYDLEMVVLAAEHIGFDSQQKAYIESKIPDLVYMENVTWEQSLEINRIWKTSLSPWPTPNS